MEESFNVVKFRVYPFANQEAELRRVLGQLTGLWNDSLRLQLTAWKGLHRLLSMSQMDSWLARYRINDPQGLGSIYSHVEQNQLHRQREGFKRFFGKGRTHLGMPRFKDEVTSFTYPDGNGSAEIRDGRNGTKRLHLAFIGEIPVKVHRPIPNGTLGPVTVKRESDHWFAILTFKSVSSVEPIVVPASPIGIDLGLHSLVATSDGQTFEPSKLLQKAERRLKRLHRGLSRKVKGSENRERQKIMLQAAYRKVRNGRMDFLHKLTTDLVREHDGIAFEDLRIPNMLKNHHLAKAISDAGWGELKQMVAYKLARKGGRFVEVDARNTTQECSRCGSLPEKKMSLSVRTKSCSICGLVMDRDVNAAINILHSARFTVQRNLPVDSGEVKACGEVNRLSLTSWNHETPSFGTIGIPSDGSSTSTFGGG